jgi:hypothetical protein
MADKIPLRVIFTMDCQPSGSRGAPEGPKSWHQSAQAIDGFCTRLLRAGFPPTLFLTPRCAQEHAPLLVEKAGSGAELGIYVQPQSLEGRGYGKYLGDYDGDTQREIVRETIERFQEALERRPLSVRTGMFSANDATFSVLYELGFRQGSVSNPGRRVGPHAASWTGAVRDAHYVDPTNRLIRGDLAFLEIPVTSDADEVRGGVASDLAIENGPVATWHRPLIEGQLARMETEEVTFRALCLYTRNAYGFRDPKDLHAQTLDGLIEYLSELSDSYELMPATLAGAHAGYRDRARKQVGI